jgi:hypothetical protein
MYFQPIDFLKNVIFPFNVLSHQQYLNLIFSSNFCQTTIGQTCVFPFTHQGVTHTSCTFQGGYSAAWCSTQTDSSGVHIIGNYGDCDMAAGLCTQESGPNSPSTTACKTVSGAKPNLPCVFPFRYNGRVYNSCVSAGFDDPWCSTLTNMFGVHVNGNWGNCDKSACPLS